MQTVSYTPLWLAVFGLFGILMHILKNLNEINKRSVGDLSLKKYFKLEIFSILLSVCLVAVTIIAQQEVKQLEAVGKWLGLSFVAIGYMAESIIISVSGRAERFLKEEVEERGG